MVSLFYNQHWITNDLLNFKKEKKDLQEKGRLEFLLLEMCLETALCSLRKSTNEKKNPIIPLVILMKATTVLN